MPEETSFRIALAVTLALTIATVLPFRLRARTDEKFDRRREGLAVAIVLRLGGVALWVFVLAYLIRPQSMHWAMLRLPDWVRWCGVVAGVLCCAMMWWTLRALGRNLTDTVATRRDATLVTNGPYHYVRHPFYVGAGLMMLSVTLLTASAAIGITSLIVLALLAARTPKEERQLLATFGESYRRYQAATGAFWPKLRR